MQLQYPLIVFRLPLCRREYPNNFKNLDVLHFSGTLSPHSSALTPSRFIEEESEGEHQ